MKHIKGLKKQAGILGVLFGDDDDAQEENKELVREQLALTKIQFEEEERKMAASEEQVIGEALTRMSASGFIVPEYSTQLSLLSSAKFSARGNINCDAL